MFGSTLNGANAYTNIGVETGVGSASPHKLIVMLFDGALIAVTTALQCMKAGNISGKGQAISKAMLIIGSGLRASLNKDVGGDIANNLDALYEYMNSRLLTANLKNQPEALEEVHHLLAEIREAWVAIDTTSTTTTAATTTAISAPPPRIRAYDSLEPHVSTLVKA